MRSNGFFRDSWFSSYDSYDRMLTSFVGVFCLLFCFFIVDCSFSTSEKLDGIIVDKDRGYHHTTTTTNNRGSGSHTTVTRREYYELVVKCGDEYYEVDVKPEIYYSYKVNNKYKATLYKGYFSDILYLIK